MEVERRRFDKIWNVVSNHTMKTAIQFQIFRHSKDATQGYPMSVAQTALHLGVTFDGNQKNLAENEGLVVPI